MHLVRDEQTRRLDPERRAMRARFRATAAGSSREPTPPLRLSDRRPRDAAARVKNPCAGPAFAVGRHGIGAATRSVEAPPLSLKAGQARQLSVGDDHRLEQRAHFAGALAGQPLPGGFDAGCLGRGLRGRSAPAPVARCRARRRKSPCRQRPETAARRPPRAARHRGEIDMGGEVRLAGVAQRVDHAMAARRLAACRRDPVAMWP